MSIDHDKLLALANRVSMLRVEEGCISDIEERDAIERELRALAQTAEAVEGDPWIDDAPLPEGYRVEEFVPRRWYWCTQDAAGAWISDGTYYGSYAATVVAAWRDHSETLKQAPTDAAQGAVADVPRWDFERHADGQSLKLYPMRVADGRWVKWSDIQNRAFFEALVRSKAGTHPQAALAQGDGWKLVPVEADARMLDAAWMTFTAFASDSHIDAVWQAMLAAAPSQEGE